MASATQTTDTRTPAQKGADTKAAKKLGITVDELLTQRAAGETTDTQPTTAEKKAAQRAKASAKAQKRAAKAAEKAAAPVVTDSDSSEAPAEGERKAAVTPREMREKAQKLLNRMQKNPFRALIVAAITEHDAGDDVSDNDKLAWVIEVLDLEPARFDAGHDDPYDLATAKRVGGANFKYMDMCAKIANPLVPLDVEDLNARHTAVINSPFAGSLRGKVAKIVASPGDLTITQNRNDLRWALGEAEKVVGRTEARAEDIRPHLIDLDQILHIVRKWNEQGWLGELELDEKELADRTEHQERPYVPWKTDLLENAVKALEEDGDALLTFIASNGGVTRLFVAIKAFRDMVKSVASRDILEDSPRLRQQMSEFFRAQREAKAAQAAQASE